MIEKSVKRIKMLSTAIALVMIVPAILTTVSAQAPTDTAQPTLSVYGYQNFGAGDTSILDPLSGEVVEDPPYTDAVAPFNPQHSQAPVKDSITFNPIYLSEVDSNDELMGPTRNGDYLDDIKATGVDANEKVFMRQWYEPWHWDKDVDGDGCMYGPYYDEELLHGELQWLRDLPVQDLQDLGWLDEDDEIYPAIMQEFTYMFVEHLSLDETPEPIPAFLTGSRNSFVFPVGIREDPETRNPAYQYLWSPYGYGLTGLDANFDGVFDETYIESEKTLYEETELAADFNGDQNISGLDTDGYQLSGDELVIFRTEEFTVERGEYVQFLDHMIKVVDTFEYSRQVETVEDIISAVKVEIWYTGDLEPEFLGYQVIDSGDMALVGRKLPVTYIRAVPNGGEGTNLCDFPTGPWFIYVSEVDTGSCCPPSGEEARIMVGRALGHTHTAMEDGKEEQDLRHGDPWWLKRFYVDGHEYNVVAIETVYNATQWGAADLNWTGPADPYYNDLDAAFTANVAEQDNNKIEPAGFSDFFTRDETGFKYITIRTPIPKSGQRQNPATVDPAHEIVYADRDAEYSQQGASDDDIRNLGYYHLIEQHSIRLQPYFIDDYLSVMAPFNYEHTILLDIQKNWSGIWDMTITNNDWVSDPMWIGPQKAFVPPVTQTGGSYMTRYGDTITAEHMMYVEEDRNPQFKGELKELLYEYSMKPAGTEAPCVPEEGYAGLDGINEYLCSLHLNEGWYVEQWNTLPDEYTEFILPAGNELYLFTSAFTSQYAIGRILNQELGEDDIADERMWGQNDDEFGGDIPAAVLRAFGDDFLSSPQLRLDRDGPFFREYWYEYFQWIYGEDLWGSAWSGSYTNGIQYINGNRVKLWFDPVESDKKYKDDEGIRLYGFDSLGPGKIDTYDPWTIVHTGGDRDGDGDPDIIEYPPYTDPMAPFSPQSDEAPPADSLTFDPAYMNEYAHGGEILSDLYQDISIEESDAREKVFFRMWYEPWHWDKDVNSDGSLFGPDAMWLFDPDFQEVWYWPVNWLQGKDVPSDERGDGYVEEFAGQDPPMLYGRDDWEFLDSDDEIHPALMQEFTYMYVNPYNDPDHGQPATSRFAFPMATTYAELDDDFGYGITTFDCDFDGVEDICTIHSENSLAAYTGIQVDFNGDGIIQQLDRDTVALNGNEIVVFAVHNVNLDTVGQNVMFLDAMVQFTGTSATTANFNFYRTSGTTSPSISSPEEVIGTAAMSPGDICLVEHTEQTVQLSQGDNNLGQTDGAWFIYVEAIDQANERVVVTVGRALGCTHTAMDYMGSVDEQHNPAPGDPWYMKRFYVDGHEYNVVAIMTVVEEARIAGGWMNSKEEDHEFKYITIRTQVPKTPVLINQHSVRKQEYIPCSDGEDHYISVMPPFNYDHTCIEDVQAGWSDPVWLSDNNYMGDLIKAKPPVEIHIEEETREPEFKGELKEKYNKRPLVYDLVVDAVDGGAITGFIDGRAVVGEVYNPEPTLPTETVDDAVVGDMVGPWVEANDMVGPSPLDLRWIIRDGVGDLIYNQNGQEVSTFSGKFVFYDWDDDGDEEWIMCIDYLNLTYHTNALDEDYLCFFAVYDSDDNTSATGTYYWDPDVTDGWEDWETWMTEQFHTIPDVYTEISINEGTDETKDQLYMLTSAWESDQSQIRIPYYEDGALREGESDWYEFYVPEWLFLHNDDVTIEIFLNHEHDSQTLLLELYDTDKVNVRDSVTTEYVSQGTITNLTNISGKYWVKITAIDPWYEDLAPESYTLLIEVRGIGARVKFWYDPDDERDIYVNGATRGCQPGKGDYNMDGYVDFTDFVAFANSYNNPGAYTACFDFDDDGDIDFFDFVEFANRYGLCSCRDSNCPDGSCSPSGDWVIWYPTDAECPCCGGL